MGDKEDDLKILPTFVYDQSSYPANADSDDENGADLSDINSTTVSKTNLNSVQSLQEDPHDDASCAVCAEVLVDPCTLHCGHSFCQLCLASLWKSSSNKSPLHLCCPVCRQPWVNFPGINIQLRNIIEKSHGKLVNIHRAQHSITDEDIIGLFNQAKEGDWSKERQQQNLMRPRLCVLLFAVLLFGLVTVLGMICFMLALSGASRDFMRKPVVRWNNGDVVEWVEGLGDWALHNNISHIFLKEKINGAQLLLLNKAVLHSIGIHTEFQVQSLLLKIDELKQQDYSTPRNFPEFMAAHRKNTILIGVLYKLWPRFTLVYVYVFEYYDIFLPVWQYGGSHPTKDIDEMEYRLIAREMAVFGLELILVPHYVIGMFAWHWFSLHPWLCTAVIIHCIWATQREAKGVVNYIASVTQIRVKLYLSMRIFFKSGFQFVLSVGAGLMIWPFIPYFLCDILLYLVIWNTVYTQLLTIPFKLFTARRQRVNFFHQDFVP